MAIDSTEYKKRTMKAYNALSAELAGIYDHHFETSARLEADHFLSRLSKGDTILDLGCGVGSASRYFAEQGYAPVAADLSEEMVKECKRRCLTSPVRLDLEVLPFQYSSFDGVWAHTSLLHIPKQRLPAAIEGLEKILTQGGVIFIALREGTEEGYEGQDGMERWFDYFQADEFESYIPSTYCIVRSSRTEGQSVTFLNYLLVKGSVH
jgi:cyclopropane fatty-acyl-phospholipid synthase-like methyltransferase